MGRRQGETPAETNNGSGNIPSSEEADVMWKGGTPTPLIVSVSWTHWRPAYSSLHSLT